MKTIEITFDVKTGSINIEADGFADSKCLDALKEIEKVLGRTTNVTLKAEARRNKVSDGTIKAGS